MNDHRDSVTGTPGFVNALELCLVVLAFSACDPSTVQPVPPVVPPAPLPLEACDDAEATLRRLDCRKPDGGPWYTTPAGTPFAEACERAQLDGRDWNPECIAAIESCAALEPAFRGELCPG